MARKQEVLTSKGVKRTSRVPNLKSLQSNLSYSSVKNKEITDNLVSRYRGRFGNEFKVIDGKKVRWDSRTNQPYDAKGTEKYVNYWKHGTETPYKDLQYLKEKGYIDHKEATGPNAVRRALSDPLVGGGKVVDTQHDLYIDKKKEALNKNLLPGTSFEKDQLLIKNEAAALEAGALERSEGNQNLPLQNPNSKSDNSGLIPFTFDPNNPQVGLGPFANMKSLHIDWDNANAQQVPFDTAGNAWNVNDGAISEELINKSLDSTSNIEYPDVVREPSSKDKDPDSITEPKDANPLKISKPGERYTGQDKRFMMADGQGERIIGGGASYGIGRKEWASMSKAQQRAARNRAAMARKRRLKAGGN